MPGNAYIFECGAATYIDCVQKNLQIPRFLQIPVSPKRIFDCEHHPGTYGSEQSLERFFEADFAT